MHVAANLVVVAAVVRLCMRLNIVVVGKMQVHRIAVGQVGSKEVVELKKTQCGILCKHFGRNSEKPF